MTRYVILFIENQWHSLNLDHREDYQEFHRFGTDGVLITFQSPELLRHLKNIKRVQIIPEIVDLEGFEKQMGQEGRDIKSYKNWTMLAALKYYNIAGPDFKLTRSTIPDF